MVKFTMCGTVIEARKQCIQGGKAFALVDFGRFGTRWMVVPDAAFEACDEGAKMLVNVEICPVATEKPESPIK